MDMRKSRLSQKKHSRLIEYLILESTARIAASLVNINKTTAAYYHCRLREVIFLATEDETAFSGKIEVDESYFSSRRKGIYANLMVFLPSIFRYS